MLRARSLRRSNSRSPRTGTKQNTRSRRFALESLEPRMMLTGTWTPLANLNPLVEVGTMLLLTDGTVMETGNGGQYWEKLTPDATGSYVNGTWSSLEYSSTAGGYEARNVLPDGRVFNVGDSASNPDNPGEIYNPLTNTWTITASLTASFPEGASGVGPSTLLADGRVLAGSTSSPNTYIYNPTTDSWSAGPTKLYGDNSDHEHWTKLPDGSILTVDTNGNAGEAQRLDQTTMTWIDSGSVPVVLQTGTDNLGSGVLLPDGRVLQIGANSNTAIYTPSSTAGGTGSWTAGPVLPNGLIGGQSFDGSGNVGSEYGSLSAAMLTNGHVLMVAGHATQGTDSWHVLEFDPTAPVNNSLTDVTPNIAGIGLLGFTSRMLVLPSGQVLSIVPLSTGGPSQLYVYTPDGAPQAAWKPTIASVVANGNHYTLTGTQLNGLSVGASYGVGNEMDSNYPIIELKNAAGKVFFARTFNWSSTGVQTGSTPVTTDFTLPPGLPQGTYQLTVIANGIASNPVNFTGGVTGADVAVIDQGPSGVPFNEGDIIGYSFTVTNYGPANATKVVVTDTLGANLSYNSATTTAGTVKRSGNVVTFSIGALAVGQTATITVYVQATEDGTLSQTAVVTAKESDPNSANNTAVNSVTAVEPPIVISGPITETGKKVNSDLVATFTHANGVEAASDFIATIDWGDGTTSSGTITEAGTTYKVKGSHTYATNGSHTVTTTVIEAGAEGNVVHALMAASGAPADATAGAKPAATQGPIQPAVVSGSPAKLQPAAVDQAFVTTKTTRSRLRTVAANDAVVDDLFALM